MFDVDLLLASKLEIWLAKTFGKLSTTHTHGYTCTFYTWRDKLYLTQVIADAHE